MKILFLYSELSAYFLASIRDFVSTYGADVHIVRWPVHSDAPFSFGEMTGVTFYNKDDLSPAELGKLADKIDPHVVYVTGWLDNDYLRIASRFRKRGKNVICALDNQWTGTLRQKVASLLSPWYLGRYFTHAWVPGIRQYEFAKRMGFRNDQVMTGMYSADTLTFELAADKYSYQKNEQYPHTLLYVGRFVEEKGITDLLKAYEQLKLPKGVRKWRLLMVGEGPLKKKLKKPEGVTFMDFVQPDELPDLAGKVGAFVLPSRFEPWGVVLHEFASAELPIIASDACGSSTAFLRSGYNGFSFKAGNIESLQIAMKKIMQLNDRDLLYFGSNSGDLARQITTHSWGATLAEIASNKN